jgi:hypothetical protein
MSGSVTGYQAGVETTDVQLSYILEAAWGTTPNAAATAIRITGESLTGQKARTRPNEITGARRVSAALTTQESAGGGINFNLSYGTFDDFFAGVLGNDWSAAQTIAGVAADITATTGTNVLSSTTSNKFQNILEGQWIELRGFAAGSGANNGFYRVATKTNNQSLTLAGRPIASTETPAATSAQVRTAGMLRNGDMVKSYFAQKRLASNLWLRYPGLMFGGMTLSGGVGQFFSGSFQALAREELNQTAAGGNGTVNAAPTGGFFDCVAGFGGVQIDDAAVTAVVNSVALNITREGAGMDYGMGSAAAQGARWGQLSAGGQVEIFFRDFTHYTLFKNETRSRIAWRMREQGGVNNNYIVTLAGANLMNPQITAGGPNQPVMARFDIEGGNDIALPAIQIDRFAA